MRQQILKFLGQIGQEHLAEGLEQLSEKEQTVFWEQLQSWGADLLREQRSILEQPIAKKHIEPPLVHQAGLVADKEQGRKLIASGKVGCLVLAGGQGSRLGSDLPKALVEISRIKKKRALQLICEKVRAASEQAGQPLSLAIMASPLNSASIASYLQRGKNFGLRSKQIDLFEQGMLPLLDEQRNWFLVQPGKIASGPDGNGGALPKFWQSGIGEKWRDLGVEAVNIILIDNPLADPFDEEFCGFHSRLHNEISLKGILREDPLEKIGVIGRVGNRVRVVEYSEIDPEQRMEREGEGQLRFQAGNTGLICVQMGVIERSSRWRLPWHAARKMAYGRSVWKCESFLFDHLDHIERAGVLIYPRSQTYAPLKNGSGQDSLATVQEALLQADRTQWTRISGKEPPRGRLFELDPAFYYPTPALLAKWQGRSLPDQDYISS